MSGLKGIRFTQRYWWWQRDHQVLMLPWRWDDNSDDEAAVVDAIRVGGNIVSDALGFFSDTTSTHKMGHLEPLHIVGFDEPTPVRKPPRVTEPMRQQTEWEEARRQQQLERERQAEFEWRAEEVRRRVAAEKERQRAMAAALPPVAPMVSEEEYVEAWRRVWNAKHRARAIQRIRMALRHANDNDGRVEKTA